MADFVEEFLHDFFLFDVADFLHDFGRFIHHFFNALLFHVSRVNYVKNFIFQLIIQEPPFSKSYFVGPGPPRIMPFNVSIGKKVSFACTPTRVKYSFSCMSLKRSYRLLIAHLP